MEYARYWHGYLIVLKPVLLFFDYADLRVINLILELLLILSVFNAFRDIGCKGEAWSYVTAVLFMMPVVIPLSIQFSVVFYLTNIAVLILLRQYAGLKSKKLLLLYFQLIGMAASFFDLLTYPIASLGVPLICLLLLDDDRSLWMRIKNIISLSVCWGFGYGAMWAGKWVLSTLILRDNIITNVLRQIQMRSSHMENGERFTSFETWVRNVEFYFERPYLILVVIGFIAALMGIFRNRRQIRAVITDIFPFMVTALMPFVWYAVIAQHSYEHHWFTFRGLMTSVFACMCICVRLCETRDMEQHRNRLH